MNLPNSTKSNNSVLVLVQPKDVLNNLKKIKKNSKPEFKKKVKFFNKYFSKAIQYISVVIGLAVISLISYSLTIYNFDITSQTKNNEYPQIVSESLKTLKCDNYPCDISYNLINVSKIISLFDLGIDLEIKNANTLIIHLNKVITSNTLPVILVSNSYDTYSYFEIPVGENTLTKIINNPITGLCEYFPKNTQLNTTEYPQFSDCVNTNLKFTSSLTVENYVCQNSETYKLSLYSPVDFKHNVIGLESIKDPSLYMQSSLLKTYKRIFENGLKSNKKIEDWADNIYYYIEIPNNNFYTGGNLSVGGKNFTIPKDVVDNYKPIKCDY